MCKKVTYLILLKTFVGYRPPDHILVIMDELCKYDNVNGHHCGSTWPYCYVNKIHF